MPDPQQKAVVRMLAPSFNSKAWWNGKIQDMTLEQFRGKYVVLFFYPLDFTFVCPTEIIQFSDSKDKFEALNTQVIACSTDSVYAHMEWTKVERKKGGLGKEMAVPMLSDVTHQISKAYKCFVDYSDKDAGVSLRATYIIDGKGILRHMSMNDLPVGRDVNEVLRLVEAFQYTDKYGEVCPASWKPGKPTMQADPESEKTKKYFEEVHGKTEQPSQ